MGFKLDQFMIGFIAFSFLIVTAVFFIQDMNNNYSTINASTDSFGPVYNTINETYGIGENMKNLTLDADISDTTTLESMTKNTFSALRLIKNTFTLIGDIMQAISLEIGIPTYMITFALVALTFLITWAIILLILRLRS